MASNSSNPTSRLEIDRHSGEKRATTFKDVSGNFAALFASLVAFISLLQAEKGQAFFHEHFKVMVAIIVLIVLHFMFSITQAVLPIRNSLPLLVLTMVDSAVLILATTLISYILTCFVTVCCVVTFVSIAHNQYEEFPEGIKKFIKCFKPEGVVSILKKFKQWIENRS